jgi:molybdenum cofactor sulfurtransferase
VATTLTSDRIDEFRARDFRRLEAAGQVYLDYTGGSLYAESHVRRHMELLLTHVLGNPHSGSPASTCASDLVAAARARVLRHFNAPASEYTVAFTANATHALKLVGEAYPFAPGGRYALTFDNHNSVNGIREFARARGAAITYVPLHPGDMTTATADVEAALALPAADGARRLFAYPAQSNFSGVQHPFEWIDAAHQRGWDVLLDAAAFTATNRLDLDRVRPDFVSLSFYKMFGYPTGIGALVARHAALEILRRPWYSGGTITVASVSADRYFLEPGHAAFEDGTLDYASLPAVAIGLDLLDEIGIDAVHARVAALTARLLERILALRHRTGRPLVAVYGPTGGRRGGTVAMNVYDPDGRFVDHTIIERRAAARGISIRTGCFCNPGASEVALDLPAERLAECFSGAGARFSREEFRRCVDGHSSGAVRVSLGWVSNAADVDAFVGFAADFLDRPAGTL